MPASTWPWGHCSVGPHDKSWMLHWVSKYSLALYGKLPFKKGLQLVGSFGRECKFLLLLSLLYASKKHGRINQNTPNSSSCCLSLIQDHTPLPSQVHALPSFPKTHFCQYKDRHRLHKETGCTNYSTSRSAALLIAQKSGWERGEQCTRGTVCFPPDWKYRVGVFLFNSRAQKQ